MTEADGTVEIRDITTIGPNAIAITIESPDGFDPKPGQFVKLRSPESETARFYSLSSPTAEETFEITVAIDPEGDLGPWLAGRNPGDEVAVSGPFGNTYYDGEPRVVVLAGGPGVGPAVGIAERALADGNEAAIVYRDDEPMHEERLSSLAAMGASVAVVAEEAAFRSAVGEALEDDAQVFVYGFADFLDLATDALWAAGEDPDAAKVENFG